MSRETMLRKSWRDNKILDGVELYYHLIRRFRLEPKEALKTMQDNGQDISSVLIHLEEILSIYTINLKKGV